MNKDLNENIIGNISVNFIVFIVMCYKINRNIFNNLECVMCIVCVCVCHA